MTKEVMDRLVTSASTAPTIFMFANNLLEEIENVDEYYSPTIPTATSTTVATDELEFAVFGSDIATVRSPPLLSLVHHYSETSHGEVPLQPPFTQYTQSTDQIDITQVATTTDDESAMSFSKLVPYFLLILPVVTVLGNVLVVASICIEKSLRSSTNYYILSLAFADIMVGAVVMPFAVYVEFSAGVWNLGYQICDFWVACDVMACTASILHLVAISIDRLMAVTKPILYARNKNLTRVWVSIGIAWSLSALIALPIILGVNRMGLVDHHRDDELECTFYNAKFILASSLASFYIPSLAIVIPYAIIFHTLRKHAKKMHKTKILRHLSRSIKPKSNDNNREENTVTMTPPIVGEEAGGAHSDQAQPFSETLKTNNSSSEDYPTLQSTPRTNPVERKLKHFRRPFSKKNPKTQTQTVKLLSPVRTPQLHQRTKRTAMSKEKRATTLMIIVLLLFFGCWIPFFTANTINAVCLSLGSGDRCLDGNVMSAFVWLGYVNSSMNPIVYAVFNVEFRKAFRKILHL